MVHTPRDYVGPEYWDKGVPAATLSYNLNAYRSASAGRSTNRGHVDLLTGANYDSWHLRHRSSFEVMSGGSATYRSVATYLTHDIPEIRSNLTIGDAFTDGAVFDSFGFRGVSLASSDQMLPDSQRDFAPVVRGIARTNARVVITQNGVTLLETTVSPGPFEINDLYATGYGGDLIVVVHEADGAQESFIVPYSPMPQLLRPGVWRYNVTAGSLQLASTTGSDLFSQATLQHGFSSLSTGYGGVVGTRHYGAVLLGIALNTSAGALSADVTGTRASLADSSSYTGQGVRFSYSKLLRSTDTSITLAAEPFLSKGYYSLTEAQAVRQAILTGADPTSAVRVRRQWQVSINQNLPRRWGNFFLAASVRDNWHSTRRATQLQGGYTNQFRFAGLRLSYGIAIAHQNNVLTGDHDNRVQMNFSLPLGSSRYSPALSTSFTQDTSGGVRSRGGQEVLIGSAGENHQLSYSVSASQTPADSAYTANGQYRGAYSSVAASVSRGSGYSQQSLGATGGLVVHRGGVTLSNQLTDTFGIVEADGAEGARVTNSIGTIINKSGYAVLPFLLPYRMNSVTIDPEGAVSPDVEFKSTTLLVAPRLNSVVLIRFKTVTGHPILITARQPDRSDVPFGASVLDSGGSEVGLVGQDGRIYLRGIPDAGTLSARWGDAPDQQCTFTYKVILKIAGSDSFERVDVTCRAGGAVGQQQ